MSLNESIVENAMRIIKIEIGRVKSRSPFLHSLFTLHSSSSPAIPEEPRKELRVAAAEAVIHHPVNQFA